MTDHTNIQPRPAAATPAGGVLYVGPSLGRSLVGIATLLATTPRAT